MNVYKEIYQSNLTKTLLFKSNSFSSDSVTFFFPMQISINILNSVHGEPLQNKNIHTHVAYIWFQEKRKSNSHWLKQKWSLLVHISKRSISRADFRSNLIQMFQIASGLQFRLPLILWGGAGGGGYSPEAGSFCIRKTSCSKFKCESSHHTIFQEGVFFQLFLRKPLVSKQSELGQVPILESLILGGGGRGTVSSSG